MLRVRSENHASRPRLRVTVANNATTSAGTAANRLSSATIRTWRPEPASCWRRADKRPQTCQEISSAISATSTPFTPRNRTTISRDGCSGVRPVRMTKVASPLRTESRTSGMPKRVGQDALPGSIDSSRRRRSWRIASSSLFSATDIRDDVPSCLAPESAMPATSPVRPLAGRHTLRDTKLKEVLLKLNRNCGNSATLLHFSTHGASHCGELDEIAHDLPRALEPLLGRLPVAHDHDLHVRAELAARPLGRDPLDQSLRIGKPPVSQPDQRSFRSGIDAGHIGGPAHQLDRHHLEEVPHLRREAAEPVCELGRKTVEIGLARDIGQPAIDAEPNLQIGDEALGDQHRGADIDLRRPAALLEHFLVAAAQACHRFLEHRLIELEPDLLDVAGLLLAEKIAGTADVEVVARE